MGRLLYHQEEREFPQGTEGRKGRGRVLSQKRKEGVLSITTMGKGKAGERRKKNRDSLEKRGGKGKEFSGAGKPTSRGKGGFSNMG